MCLTFNLKDNVFCFHTKISLSESNVLAINTSEKCWSYLKTNGTWNNISQILQSENNISMSESHNLLPSLIPIVDVYCSDTLHLAVTNNGINTIITFYAVASAISSYTNFNFRNLFNSN